MNFLLRMREAGIAIIACAVVFMAWEYWGVNHPEPGKTENQTMAAPSMYKITHEKGVEGDIGSWELDFTNTGKTTIDQAEIYYVNHDSNNGLLGCSAVMTFCVDPKETKHLTMKLLPGTQYVDFFACQIKKVTDVADDQKKEN